MQRNDTRMVVVRTVHALAVYVPFMLAQESIASLLPAFLKIPWRVLVVYYSATRFSYVLVDWLTTRWDADHTGLTVLNGWPMRERVTVPWSEVATLDIRQGWVARLLGVHSVTAIVGAEGHSSLLLEAVTGADVEYLTGLHNARPEAPVKGAGAMKSTESGTVLYRARTRDFVPLGFMHGQFLLIIPFLFGTGADLLDLLGIDIDALTAWSEQWGLAPVMVGCAVVAFAYGTLRAMLTFQGYTVRRHDWGFSSSGGLVQRDSREARLEHIVGVRIVRNPLMRLTGTCSVHLVLATGRGDSKSLPVLPLVSLREVPRHLARLLPDPHPEVMQPRSRVEPALVALLAVGLAVTGWFIVGPWAAGLTLIGILPVADALAVRIGRNATTVWIDTGVVYNRVRIVDADAVRTISFLSLARPGRRGWLSLRVLDRRARTHRVPGVPATVAATFDPTA